MVFSNGYVSQSHTFLYETESQSLPVGKCVAGVDSADEGVNVAGGPGGDAEVMARQLTLADHELLLSTSVHCRILILILSDSRAKYEQKCSLDYGITQHYIISWVVFRSDLLIHSIFASAVTNIMLYYICVLTNSNGRTRTAAQL